MSFTVELVSPERTLYEGEAEMVIARMLETGEAAFLTGHAPFLGALEIDVITVRPVEGDDIRIAVHGGFVSVTGDRVTVLSDIAELAESIDETRAIAAQDQAEVAVKANPDDDDATAALARARARMKALGK